MRINLVWDWLNYVKFSSHRPCWNIVVPQYMIVFWKVQIFRTTGHVVNIQTIIHDLMDAKNFTPSWEMLSDWPEASKKQIKLLLFNPMVNIFPIVGKLYLVMDEPTAHHTEGFRSLKSGPYRKKILSRVLLIYMRSNCMRMTLHLDRPPFKDLNLSCDTLTYFFPSGPRSSFTRPRFITWLRKIW